MLKTIYLGIIIVLIVIIIVQRHYIRNMNGQLNYIKQKVQDIMKHRTLERVKVQDVSKETQQLLITINELLDYNHNNIVSYNRIQMSMKKMLANISHDLKTPLTVVMGYLEMIQIKYPEEENAHIAYAKVQEVVELINKFFDLAKLESGDKQFTMHRVNISEICRTTLIEFYSQLQKKQMQVEVDIKEADVFVHGNEEAIKRVLTNLITNAMRYGSEGKYLKLAVKDMEEYIQVEVTDKGKGIEEQYYEEIFERIYTLEDSRNKNYQGSGLGLTITKSLVETMEGEIHIHSLPYQETTFFFTLKKLS